MIRWYDVISHVLSLCNIIMCFLLLSCLWVSRTQVLQGCRTSGKFFLTETLSHGMRGEPGTHLETCLQSSCIVSQLTVDSSCGSENSTPPRSPDYQQSFASGQFRQHGRSNMTHPPHTVKVDTDTGLTALCLECLSIIRPVKLVVGC